MSSASSIQLPPYGYMHDPWMWDVHTRRVPVGFLIDGKPASAREFASYLDGETEAMAQFLWPRYDRASGQWVGAAKDWMVELTEADLDLMPEMSTQLGQSPVVSSKGLDATHQGLFEQEDESRAGEAPFPTLDIYLSKLSTDSLTALKGAIKKMSVDFGPAPLRYKEFFQRPRPYQVAYLLGRPFNYQFGRSAVTPALVSGHCLQGLVRHAAGYMSARLVLEKTVGALEGLMQHAVDYGDRRVFAGVHYPSDNISSWYCALRLCDNLYGDGGAWAKTFVAEAISRSHVYKCLTREVAKNPKSPFALPMQHLAAEIRRPPKLPEP